MEKRQRLLLTPPHTATLYSHLQNTLAVQIGSASNECQHKKAGKILAFLNK